MLLPDANVILAGFRADHVHHRPARAFLEQGSLVPDAHLAALAIESAAELVTFDRGFGRYPGLRWRSLLDR